MRHINWTSIIISLLTFSTLACDDHEFEPATSRASILRVSLPDCGVDGGLFGPCVDNECDGSTMCFTTTAGDVCVPPIITEKNLQLAQECITQIGANDLLCDSDLGFCRARCDEDAGAAACGNGMVCDAVTDSCVYPWSPIGETQGACLGWDMLCFVDADNCFVSSDVPGNICAPEDASGTINCTDNSDCPGTHLCATDLGFCVWPY